MCYPHVLFFLESALFFFSKKKKSRPHIRTYRFRPSIAWSLCLIIVRDRCFSGHVVRESFWLSPGRSSRIRHRNALTEKAWKDAVQGPAKPVYTQPFLTRDRQALNFT